MPKLKTKKKAAKRFRVTKNGKVLSHSTGRRHLLGHKSAKRKRQMRNDNVLDPTAARNIRKLLPYV